MSQGLTVPELVRGFTEGNFDTLRLTGIAETSNEWILGSLRIHKTRAVFRWGWGFGLSKTSSFREQAFDLPGLARSGVAAVFRQFDSNEYGKASPLYFAGWVSTERWSDLISWIETMNMRIAEHFQRSHIGEGISDTPVSISDITEFGGRLGTPSPDRVARNTATRETAGHELATVTTSVGAPLAGAPARPSQDSISDEHLLRKYQTGDINAFESLLRRYERPLFSFLQRSCRGDLATAEDLLQETFLTLVRRANDYDGRMVRPLLYTIARNLTVDNARRIEALRRLRERTVADSSQSAIGPDDFSTSDNQQERVAVQQAIEGLSDGEREIFLLRSTGDMSFSEIAQLVGGSGRAAEMRFRKAAEKLGDLFSKATAETSGLELAPGVMVRIVRAASSRS